MIAERIQQDRDLDEAIVEFYAEVELNGTTEHLFSASPEQNPTEEPTQAGTEATEVGQAKPTVGAEVGAKAQTTTEVGVGAEEQAFAEARARAEDIMIEIEQVIRLWPIL